MKIITKESGSWENSMEMENLYGRKENIMKDHMRMASDRDWENIRFKMEAGMKDNGLMEDSQVKGHFIKDMMRLLAIGSMDNWLYDI